jgi:hypothetical protein
MFNTPYHNRAHCPCKSVNMLRSSSRDEDKGVREGWVAGGGGLGGGEEVTIAVALDRAVEAEEIVAALRGYGFTQADIAAVVGVTPRAVRNWTGDTGLRRTHEQRLHALREIVLLLDDSLSARRVGQSGSVPTIARLAAPRSTSSPTGASTRSARPPRRSPTAPTPHRLPP